MLNKAKILTDYKLDGLDGEIGRVKEFYFDDYHWTIRYLVADTGNWLTGRNVLISPYSLGKVDTKNRDIAVNLTKKQIENSPPLESKKPVSKQFEKDYFGFYELPIYWNGTYMWGGSANIERDPEKQKKINRSEEKWDYRLRSTKEVDKYRIQAEDGDIGHVEDFIIDDETWAIRYLVVDTRNWLPGKKVFISTQWIQSVNWGDLKVIVKLSREAVMQSPEFPEYTNGAMPSRDYEERLHKHYNMRGYWAGEPDAENRPKLKK
jgi:hypothetical protein